MIKIIKQLFNSISISIFKNVFEIIFKIVLTYVKKMHLLSYHIKIQTF